MNKKFILLSIVLLKIPIIISYIILSFIFLDFDIIKIIYDSDISGRTCGLLFYIIYYFSSTHLLFYLAFKYIYNKEININNIKKLLTEKE